jgi:hypothetical protein
MCGTHVAKPAFSAVKVSTVAAMMSSSVAGGGGLVFDPGYRKSSTVLRRLVANLKAHRLASSAAAQLRPVRVVLLPKKIPGAGCRRQAEKGVAACRCENGGEEWWRWEGKVVFMCEGVTNSGSLTGDKRMTCRSHRLTDGLLAAGVTLIGFTLALHLAGFTPAFRLALRSKDIQRKDENNGTARKYDAHRRPSVFM